MYKEIENLAVENSIKYMDEHYQFNENIDLYEPKEGRYPFDGEDVQTAYTEGFKRCLALVASGEIEVAQKITEWCPCCDTEVELDAEFKVQRCPSCGELILPCNLCDHDTCDCKNCPLEKARLEMTGEK